MFCKPFLFFFNSKKCLVNQAKVKQLFCSYTFIHILTYRHKNRNRKAYIEQGRRERFSHQVNTPYPYPTYFKFPFPLLQVSHALGLSNTCKTFQKKKTSIFQTQANRQALPKSYTHCIKFITQLHAHCIRRNRLIVYLLAFFSHYVSYFLFEFPLTHYVIYINVCVWGGV